MKADFFELYNNQPYNWVEESRRMENVIDRELATRLGALSRRYRLILV